MANGSRYQDEEEKKGKWGTRLKYAAGITALVFTVVLALFLPGWYSGWREEEAMEQVVLEKREEIRFFDMEALDIGTKLAMLGDSEEFSYSVMYDLTGVSQNDQQTRKLLNEKLLEWYEDHLIPDHPFYTEEMSDDIWSLRLDAYVKIDDGVIPVKMLAWASDWGEGNIEIAILDQSNDFLYYAGIASAELLEFVIQVAGMESEDEMYRRFDDGTYSLDMARDSSWYDYASVCGADVQEIEMTDPVGIFQRVTLRYEDFDAAAYRSLFGSDGSTGVQTMFGTDRWAELVYSVINMYMGLNMGPYNYFAWISEWNTMVIEHGRADLMFQPETEIAAAEEEISGAAYGEKVREEMLEKYDGASDPLLGLTEKERALVEGYGIDPFSLTEQDRELLKIYSIYGVDPFSLTPEERDRLLDKVFGNTQAQEEAAEDGG